MPSGVILRVKPEECETCVVSKINKEIGKTACDYAIVVDQDGNCRLKDGMRRQGGSGSSLNEPLLEFQIIRS